MGAKDHIKLGKIGEEIAVGHLLAKGYRILDRNWRWGHHEIDIIAQDQNVIVIVEVKTRRSNHVAEPETAVTRKKQKILVYAANAYTRYHQLYGDVRFDIVAILLNPGQIMVNHITDAFYATLC
ncbi:MAG: YraN family protein [Bacteroidales bacterium]|nr:YraN family protein [Bacteroidales bacterium]